MNRRAEFDPLLHSTGVSRLRHLRNATHTLHSVLGNESAPVNVEDLALSAEMLEWRRSTTQPGPAPSAP